MTDKEFFSDAYWKAIQERSLKLRTMSWHGNLICPDDSMFSSSRIYKAPSYKNPTYWNAYVQILDYVNEKGEATLKDTVNDLYRGSNFDTFKTLVIYGFLKCVNPEAKRFRRFKVTDYGLEILEEAKLSKDAYHFAKFIKKSKSSCADELTLNCTLYGESQFLDKSFKSAIKMAMAKHSKAKRELLNVAPFVNDFLDS